MELLRENSLVKISLRNIERHHEGNVMITDLITKHASSLRTLRIFTAINDNVEMDYFLSTLIKNQIYLRELSIPLGGEPMQVIPSLISYLSSSGSLLEDLEVSGVSTSLNAEELVASVANSCPKLTRLAADHCEPCSIETLRRLYEQCPHLEDVPIGSFKIDDKRKYLSIEVKGHNEDWAIFYLMH
eukprot:scaffold2278_cov171-Ochromonas_danica.AAC.1